MRPLFIPDSIRKFISSEMSKADMCRSALDEYRKISNGTPEISVVMPAYNESDNIVPTLASLCHNKTSRTIEIIVSNNNSDDDTELLAIACGVKCIRESRQGITFARNAGLNIAQGKYVVNADADTIYPEDWIEEMVNPLVENNNVALTYGRFAFIPIGRTGRLVYFFFEYVAELSKWYNSKVKDEAVNVYGFNSAFRRSQGIAVDCFNHPAGTNEDGWLALKLRNKGFGKLHRVTKLNAMVWTTDRRVHLDGGIVRGVIKRIKRILNL